MTRSPTEGRVTGVTTRAPAFARDPATASYYEQRAEEYDDWYEGRGRFADRDRPGWDDEVSQLVAMVHNLPTARTLDVACGSGFLTRHLRGVVVGVDQSSAMVALTRSRLPGGVAFTGNALALPFADGTFDRVLTGELVVIDSARRPGVEPEQWQERILDDGSRHQVYKRYLAARQLAEEIDGEVLLDGTWFVAARAHRASRH